jgi:hydrophobic/amphiphilic exporter-1 (mainly G- bacteria), HAE1 family
MSKFFITRPIVAMVISIVLVLVGSLTVLNLPVAEGAPGERNALC